MGKTLYVETQIEALLENNRVRPEDKDDIVHTVRVHGTKVDVDDIVKRLNRSRSDTSEVARLFHFDVAPTVS